MLRSSRKCLKIVRRTVLQICTWYVTILYIHQVISRLIDLCLLEHLHEFVLPLVPSSERSGYCKTFKELGESMAQLDPVLGVVSGREYYHKSLKVRSCDTFYLPQYWACFDKIYGLENTDDPKVLEATRKDLNPIVELLDKILKSDQERNIALSLRGKDAENLMDVIQEVCSPFTCRYYHIECLPGQVLQSDILAHCGASRLSNKASKLLVDLCMSSKDLPPLPEEIIVNGIKISERNKSGGTFGDIYDTRWEGKRVAVKRLRLFYKIIDKSELCRVRSWYWDTCDHWHTFVCFTDLLLWGSCVANPQPPLCITVPRNWCGEFSPTALCGVAMVTNGTINEFLQKNGKVDVNQLVRQFCKNRYSVFSSHTLDVVVWGCSRRGVSSW